jgi:hypothetical protein
VSDSEIILRQGGGAVEEGPSDRSGVQLQPEHLEAGAEGPNIRPEVVLAFVRLLVRSTMSYDVLYLTLMATQTETGATPEEMKILTEAVMAERGR